MIPDLLLLFKALALIAVIAFAILSIFGPFLDWFFEALLDSDDEQD